MICELGRTQFPVVDTTQEPARRPLPRCNSYTVDRRAILLDTLINADALAKARAIKYMHLF